MADVKTCSKCSKELPLTHFSPDRSTTSGYKSACRSCRSTATRGTAPDAEQVTSMLPFALPGSEREGAEALVAYGSVAKAAEALGVAPSTLRGRLSELARRAARAGWAPDADMTKPVPLGFGVKGVSSYYDADGNLRGQWVKTKRDEEHKAELLLDAVQSIAEPFRGLAEPAQAPVLADEDLLCVYPMGDPHIGMYSWAEETGADFDLAIAERNLVAAVDQLVELAPAAKQALIVNLGDFFHADNAQNRTARAGHALDVDTRWAKVLGVGIRAMRRCIDRALQKHERVTVICEIGNHDDQTALMLALCLANYYEREPRVTIDTSPAKFHWMRFGDNLIGVTHGDTVKPHALPGIMACDRPADWGETRHRYWYTGHVHHESVKEFPGCVVETFRTLAPRDAWHAAAGYRSGQDMRMDVVHRTRGRVNRHVVGIDMICGKGGK